VTTLFAPIKRAAIFCALFALFNSSLSSAIAKEPDASNQDSPIGIVSKLYKDYAWQGMEHPIGSKEDDWVRIHDESKVVLEKYFDAELAALFLKDQACVKKTHEICNLGWDPIFDTQDPAMSNLTINLLENGNVGVQYVYPSNGEKVSMEHVVKRGPKGWRIADIIYTRSSGPSLKKILQNPLGQ
jgi:hypothetical protein